MLMKPKHSCFGWRLLPTLVIVFALATTLPQAGVAGKRVKPPKRAEVAQVWLGWSADDLYLLRFELLPNGKGIGGYVFVGEKPRSFRIDSWKYEEGQIEIFPVPPEGPPSWVAPLHGSVSGLAMKLRATGPDWKLSFLLRREVEFEEKWRRLKLEMEGKLRSPG
jgi:hypothetical protein